MLTLKKYSSCVFKRCLDVTVSLLGLVLLLPLLACLAGAIYICMGKPVLFCQKRPGLNKKLFKIYKFRTMREAKVGEALLGSDESRLTNMGRFIRKMSLDELPSLWNVLKGDMSLVGPRPLLSHYIMLYTPEQARRHEIKPGITGWAQANGRNAITWEEKFKLDVWYVNHMNMKIDIKILLMTFINVLKSAGISAQGHATMPEFTGNQVDRNEY